MRTLERAVESFERAVFAIGQAESEQAARVVVAQCREQIVHADLDDAGLDHQIGDGAYTLTDDAIRSCKSLRDPFLRQDELAHSVVLKSHHGIGNTLELLERSVRLDVAAFSLER